MRMKATSLTGTLTILLVALPSAAAAADDSPQARHHNKHHVVKARTPTAMHTTHVHDKDASAAHHLAPPVVKQTPPRPCLHEPVSIARGLEEDHFALTHCDGSATQEGVDHLSVLARADNVLRPSGSLHGVLPAGMHRIDARLVERLQQVADHFGGAHHQNQRVSMHIISGFRPTSVGSFHATAQALDFRVDGVRNEELVAFCKTLEDTGCGYYPNSSFVHLDVRAPGTGHVAWIDASGPGESPHYVTAWPPPPEPTNEDFAAKLARVLPPLPVDEHPADVRSSIDGTARHAINSTSDPEPRVSTRRVQ
jgi:hypothetical protein